MGSVYRTVAEKRKLLRLAARYRNVARACKEMNFSRDSYYRISDLYKRRGKAGLKPMSRHRPLPNYRGGEEMEKAVLSLTREHPEWGQARVAEELWRKRIVISPTGVRGVWRRNNLTTRRLRGVVWRVPRRRWDGVVWRAPLLCPNCHKEAPGTPPFICPHCKVGIPRQQ